MVIRSMILFFSWGLDADFPQGQFGELLFNFVLTSNYSSICWMLQVGFTKIILAKLHQSNIFGIPFRDYPRANSLPLFTFLLNWQWYTTKKAPQDDAKLSLSHCACLMLFVCLIEILRLILQFFWRELDEFNIYNFPEDGDIDIIPDGVWLYQGKNQHHSGWSLTCTCQGPKRGMPGRGNTRR